MIEDLKIVKLRVYISKVYCIEFREKPVPAHTLAPRVFLKYESVISCLEQIVVQLLPFYRQH